MFCVGSLMSQVLQCTQFCALITRRSLPSSFFTNSYTAAGQKRPSGPAYVRRFTFTGTFASFSVRCAGWFSSWFVFEMNTDESRSNVSLPSGFGYSIGWHCDAGFNISWSACLWCSVHGTLPPITFCSSPTISVPRYSPLAIHCLKLRARYSSV